LHYYSTSSIAAYVTLSLLCEKPLSKLIDNLSEFEEVLVYKSKALLSVYQAVLNLHNINIAIPAKLSGKKFNYKLCFEKDRVKI